MTAPQLPWIRTHQALPSPNEAWGHDTPWPGLLCASEDLSAKRLIEAYTQGIFPWFTRNEPVLWWSTDPRLVLETNSYQCHHSLRKRMRKLLREQRLQLRFDSAFTQVMHHCAHVPRSGQQGTWITPDIVNAYTDLHHLGHAHSVEAWIEGELAGGLYVVNLGHMLFGESMFALQTDASKMALTALVIFARLNHLPLIDCQQSTAHLQSLGATEWPRDRFLDSVAHLSRQSPPSWVMPDIAEHLGHL